MEKVFLVQYVSDLEDLNRYITPDGGIISVTGAGDGTFAIVATDEDIKK